MPGQSLISSPISSQSSQTFFFAYASDVAEYQPSNKSTLSRVFDWGLAKVENIYDGKLVKDLIATFILKCDHIVTIMFHSFRELTLSYNDLHTKEVERLDQFDVEFRDLVKLRNKIDRKCLYSTSVEDRALCIDNGMDIHNKINDLRIQRTKSEGNVERYKGMIEWCALYNNWFC